MCLLLPERMGWIPFKNTEMASSGVRLETASITSASLVKSMLNGFFSIRTTALKIILMMMEVETTTITENLATLGWAAPSSLPTRMLQSNAQEDQTNIITTINGPIYVRAGVKKLAIKWPSFGRLRYIDLTWCHSSRVELVKLGCGWVQTYM